MKRNISLSYLLVDVADTLPSPSPLSLPFTSPPFIKAPLPFLTIPSSDSFPYPSLPKPLPSTSFPNPSLPYPIPPLPFPSPSLTHPSLLLHTSSLPSLSLTYSSRVSLPVPAPSFPLQFLYRTFPSLPYPIFFPFPNVVFPPLPYPSLLTPHLTSPPFSSPPLNSLVFPFADLHFSSTSPTTNYSRPTSNISIYENTDEPFFLALPISPLLPVCS